MSNHRFDQHSLKEWLRGLEKPNEDDCLKALSEIDDPRMKDIVISHIFEKKTYAAIGTEHGISAPRACQIFWTGIREIRRKIGR